MLPGRVDGSQQSWQKALGEAARPIISTWILVGILAIVGFTVVARDRTDLAGSALDARPKARWDSRIERAVPYGEPERPILTPSTIARPPTPTTRSQKHTSELQSPD